MKPDSCPVKSKSQVVGTAEFQIYDSTEEAVGHLTEEVCVSLINAQVKTNAMNVIRGAATGKPSKTHVRNLALTEVTAEEWREVAGDNSAIAALVERKMVDVEARLAAARPDLTEEEEDED